MLSFGCGLTASTKQWTPVQPGRWLWEDLWGLPGVNPNGWSFGNLVLGSLMTSSGVRELLYLALPGSHCFLSGDRILPLHLLQHPALARPRTLQHKRCSKLCSLGGVYSIGNFVSLTSNTLSVNLLHQYGCSHYYRAGRGCTNTFSIAFQLCFTLYLIQI